MQTLKIEAPIISILDATVEGQERILIIKKYANR